MVSAAYGTVSERATTDLDSFLNDPRVADPNTAPLLKLLFEHKLIDCGNNPRDASESERVKIQLYVYFAKNVFGLAFTYSHGLFEHGPYSPQLASDYYLLPDISEADSRDIAYWTRMDEFLQFAHSHDLTWIEIASTLIHVEFRDGIVGTALPKHVTFLKPTYTKKQVEQVYDELLRLGYMR